MSDDEKAKLGYQIAFQIIAYEGQLIWRTFSAMVTANSFLVALTTFASRPSVNYPFIRFVPIFGLALCAVWLLAVKREYGSYAYWFACARALESTYLSPVVQITTEGERYARGEIVKVADKEYRLNWSARAFKVKHLMFTAILIFAVLYVLLFIAPWLGA